MHLPSSQKFSHSAIDIGPRLEAGGGRRISASSVCVELSSAGMEWPRLTRSRFGRRTWLAKDEASGKQLAARVQEVATEEGYTAALHVSHAGEQVTVDVASPGIGGLTDNDFILAAKVDSLDFTDVVKPARRRTQFY